MRPEEAVEQMNIILETIKTFSKKYRITPTYGLIECHRTHVYLHNSQDFRNSYKKSDLLGGIRTLIDNKGRKGNGMEAQFCSCLDDFNPVQIGEESCKQSLESLKSKKIPTQKTELIIEPHGSAKFFIPFTKALFANNVKNQQSLLKDRIGDEIGSTNITFFDDGVLKGGLGSQPFDDEGVASKTKCIVEQGVLKDYLYDLQTAAEMNVNSTGNGLRCTFYPYHKKYRCRPTIGVTNFLVKEGDISREEIISETQNGVIATFLVGDGDPTTGDFSFEIRNGYKIENGEVKHSIKQASFSGNILSALKKIQHIADNSRTTQAFLGVGQGAFITPSIQLQDTLIVGE
jgi:PmbA protein